MALEYFEESHVTFCCYMMAKIPIFSHLSFNMKFINSILYVSNLVLLFYCSFSMIAEELKSNLLTCLALAAGKNGLSSHKGRKHFKVSMIYSDINPQNITLFILFYHDFPFLGLFLSSCWIMVR